MRWALEWGDKRIYNMLVARERRGERVPALETEPDLFADLRGVWNIFMQLSPQRQQGMNGALPLSTQTTLDVLRVNGYDGDELRTALRQINVLDAELLRHSKARKKA